MEEAEEVIDVPVFETERLLIRTMTEDDIDFVFRHFGKDEVNRYSAEDNVRSVEEAVELFNKYLAHDSPTRFRSCMILKETGEPIGTIGLFKWSRRDRRAELGYDLDPVHWGKGLMLEALQPVLEFGFRTMGLNRIEATANTENSRSLALLEKAGFKKEGVMRQRFHYNGKFQDDVMYALLKGKWNKK